MRLLTRLLCVCCSVSLRLRLVLVRAVQLPEGGICIDSADIQCGEDKLKRKHVFTVLTPERTYFIQAANTAEMNDWMATLQRIADLAQKRRMVDFADSKLKR